MKALGTGGTASSWRDFEVVNLPSGRPTLYFHGKAAEIAAKLGVERVALSLTHTKDERVVYMPTPRHASGIRFQSTPAPPCHQNRVRKFHSRDRLPRPNWPAGIFHTMP